jgi:hypothetical protein
MFDSPFSCDMAEEYARKRGVSGFATQAGDIEKGSLPKGKDAVVLTHVLQSIAPQKCEAMLKRIFDSLPKGGKIVVNEFRLEQGNVFSQLLGLNAFMLSNGGSLRPSKEIMGWMANVGFTKVNVLKTSGEVIVSLVGEKA